MGLFPTENFNQYQTLLPLKVDGAKLQKLAESISYDVAYQLAAIGGIEEFEEKVEALAKAGLKQVVVSELSPPKRSQEDHRSCREGHKALQLIPSFR